MTYFLLFFLLVPGCSLTNGLRPLQAPWHPTPGFLRGSSASAPMSPAHLLCLGLVLPCPLCSISQHPLKLCPHQLAPGVLSHTCLGSRGHRGSEREECQ